MGKAGRQQVAVEAECYVLEMSEYEAKHAIATYKDLCIDAVDAWSLGDFWAATLGLECRHLKSGHSQLVGPTPAHAVWVNQVPEAKAVKHRAHLDVHGRGVQELLDLGAMLIDADSFRWTVLMDPEGGEFCLFTADDPPAYRLYEVVIDVEDHRRAAAFWAEILGGQAVEEERGYSFVVGGAGVPFDCVTFIPVEEPKKIKNRIHLDLVVPNLDALAAAGAQMLRPQEGDIQWSVWADPEGNEFCAFDPATLSATST